MNQAKRAMLFFKEYALKKGFSYKVVGDHAFSSRPMGQGRYLKLISVKGEILTCYESPSKSMGFRFELELPSDFQPKDS